MLQGRIKQHLQDQNGQSHESCRLHTRASGTPALLGVPRLNCKHRQSHLCPCTAAGRDQGCSCHPP